MHRNKTKIKLNKRLKREIEIVKDENERVEGRVRLNSKKYRLNARSLF